MIKAIFFAAVLAASAGVCSAEDRNVEDQGDHEDQHVCPVAAPELDPSSMMSGLTLLAGVLVLLRGRKVKNTEA